MKNSTRNALGRSSAKYCGEPNQEGWKYEGEMYKDELAKQCSGEDYYVKYCTECDTKYHVNSNNRVCPECGSSAFYFKRCTRRAEPNSEVCDAHGAKTKPSKQQRDKYVAAVTKTGMGITSEILMCTETCPIAANCPFKGELVNIARYGSDVPRCMPEERVHDVLIERFREEYELDDVADQIMLTRLAMSMIRLLRGEKIIAAYGELVDRVKTAPDGSYETWQEVNPVVHTVDQLDKRVQAWLKELAVSKAAREGRKISVSGSINLTNLLCDPKNASIIDEDQIIDIELEE